MLTQTSNENIKLVTNSFVGRCINSARFMKHFIVLWIITGRGLMWVMSDPSAAFNMTSFCYYASNYPGKYTVMELKKNKTTPKFKFTCNTDEAGGWHYQIVK